VQRVFFTMPYISFSPLGGRADQHNYAGKLAAALYPVFAGLTQGPLGIVCALLTALTHHPVPCRPPRAP